jgi:hypothetical protein
MKRILLGALLLVTQLTTAQVILNEGFEVWPPDWEFYQLGEALYGWRDSFDGTAYKGERSAHARINNDQCDNWDGV